MVNRKTAALLLASSLAFTMSGCWGSDSADSVAETPSVEMQDSSVSDSGEAADSEKEQMPDENGLVPTDDPNVFKATRVLPRPESALKYPKPKYPEIGHEHSYEGAEAVALYFHELIPYVINTGDLEDFRVICSAESSYCKKTTAVTAKNLEEGNWSAGIKASELKIEKWGVPPVEKNKGEYSFIISGDISEHVYFDKPSMTYTKKPGYTIDAFVNLSFVDGRWVVVAAGSEKK